jgi:hypothetical protein
MNEVSIIINGVRYDAVANILPRDCYGCDFADYCNETEFNIYTCHAMIGDDRYFQKSNKKFER